MQRRPYSKHLDRRTAGRDVVKEGMDELMDGEFSAEADSQDEDDNDKKEKNSLYPSGQDPRKKQVETGDLEQFMAMF